MQFVLTSGWEEAAAAVAKRLVDELSNDRRVLWLVSGGSQITANVQIMSQIPDELSRNLSVTLVDERYGPIGHADSNWQQLINAGFPDKQATLYPVIQAGLGFEQNTAYFKEMIEQAFSFNDVLIGQLGIGPDGHTAGILPHSAASAETTALAIGYDAPPLKRLTTTFPALKQLTAAYVLAYGDNKRESLSKLKNQDLPLSEQPSQILKELSEAYIYNDQVGEA
ncbi:MAG TPA: 6-phosphogluconolactonase [Candidatus Saccharimonadales bacterium]|jgi:6-phosphogluconolactonase/glucosamine-6-phosphate isomerase/deaminase|nr:6-phosphogluconolactonase [Candidatus Saccharimonadales bacterium]